eukprot:gene20680-27475_t
MVKQKVQRVYVCNGSGEPCGIITSTDVLRIVAPFNTHKAPLGRTSMGPLARRSGASQGHTPASALAGLNRISTASLARSSAG